MKSTQRIMLVAVPTALLLVAHFSPVGVAQTTLISQLANWDVAPTGSIFPGGDFDPTLDTTPNCSGCWYGKSTGSGITYSYSTAHTTQGTGALKAVIVGKGSGGSYTVNINGSPVTLDTHFDNPLLTTYSSNAGANGGVLDARFTALNDAINSGQQALYNIEFDIIYDVASMRSIPWQPPEETVDPLTNGQYPQRYFWTGSQGVAIDSFEWVGYDANNITPFDAEYDGNLFPVFHASFPLDAFGFVPDAEPGQHNYRTIGLLYNSVFGTLPASANTSGVTVYFDNLRLTKLNPVGPIDYNNNGQADPGDWQLFMAQLLVTDPPAPVANPSISFDLVGAYGAAGTNGVVDFHDMLKFQEFYSIANPGSAAILFGSVPEPGTLVLVSMSMVGLLFGRSRRLTRVFAAVGAVTIMLALQVSAQAQVVESFETAGRWQPYPNADPNAMPITVAYSTSNATNGANSLKVTQGGDTAGGFSWNAYANPNWTTGDTAWDVLSQAVRVGAEHYNLLVDVTFDPDDLINQGVETLSVTLGLNFNGETIGSYAGETEIFTTTATIPLSNFDLGDSVDDGVTSYGAEIGFSGNSALGNPYSIYVDNMRLEQISTPDLLTLEVNRGDGSALLKNLTANPISWNYFDIKSAGNSLNPSGWSSLDDQNADGANTWIEAGGSSASELTEASLLGSHTLAPGGTLPLGFLYNNGINAEDLDFVIRRAAGPTNRTYDQIVTYIGTPPAGVIGDYNGDHVVDAADYTIWRDNLGADGSTLGANRDPANVGVVGTADYNSWKAHFGQTSGAGSLAAAAVPEPSAFVMCVLAVLLGCHRRRID